MDLLLESGVVDQRIPFYTGSTGLASGSTVYRQRGTNAAAAMTTPDIVEDATVAGLYRLLLDEDTTITAGKSTEALTIVITHASLANPIVLKVVLYDALKANVKQINSHGVTGTGTSGDLWKGV
jgi:hypothetical protein